MARAKAWTEVKTESEMGGREEKERETAGNQPHKIFGTSHFQSCVTNTGLMSTSHQHSAPCVKIVGSTVHAFYKIELRF